MFIRNALAAAALTLVSVASMASASWSAGATPGNAHFSGTESAAFTFDLFQDTTASSSFVLNTSSLYTVTLSGGSLASPVSFADTVLGSFHKYSFSGALAAGSYKLTVLEAGVTGSWNVYNGAFHYQPGALDLTSLAAAPVPEPESYAMLLAGLGAVGFMARRRQSK